MAENETDLVLSWQPAGRNGTVVLTAAVGGVVIATDKLDVLKEKARRSFADALIEKYPALDRAALDAELLRIAFEVANHHDRPAEAENAGEPVDVSQVVRPELFHRPEVSGMLVPSTVRRITDDGPRVVGRWDMFLRWKDGRRQRVPFSISLDTDNGTIYFDPIPSDPLPTRKAGWSKTSQAAWLDGAERPDIAELFVDLSKQFARFLHFQQSNAPGNTAVLGCWTILSYGLPAWDACPYLRLTGPKGSGKSRVLELLEQLVYRPMPTSSASAPTLFRRLHSEGGVILLDEAESLRRTNDPGAQDVANVFLSGYRKGGSADRLEKVGDGFQPVSFSTFGLKALASIGEIPDALESRCIPIRMFRCPNGSEKPRRRIRPADPIWQGLRDRLHHLALEAGPQWIAMADDAGVCPEWIGGRDFEKWQPILAIAKWIEAEGIEGLHDLLLDHVTAVLEGDPGVAVPDVDAILLRTLARKVRWGESPTAGDILKTALEEEPNGFTRWTAHAVGRHLRQYGLQTTKTNGRWVYRPDEAQLAEIELAYGIELT